MTMIAYTRTANILREAGFRSKKWDEIKSSTSSNSRMAIGHIPQTGTRETLCGRPMYQQLEVDIEADIPMCKKCQERLQGLVRKLPGCDLVRSLLGNNLLPAGDH